MNDSDPQEVVRLLTAPNPAQASIWEQALRAAGVDCKVVGEYLDAGIGNIPGIQPEIWVHRRDLAKAREVLERPQERASTTGHSQAT
jgi:hypothetical protein